MSTEDLTYSNKLAPNVEEGLYHLKESFCNHVHITGQSRTGTTLIKNLFHCFENTVVTPGETYPDLSMHFQGTVEERRSLLEDVTSTIVTKQPGSYKLLKKYRDLQVVLMIRDPRDLLASINPTRPDSQWHSYQGLADYFKVVRSVPSNYIKIRYEDLVQKPDTVQELLTERLNLVPICSFSRWHELEFYEQDLYVRGMRGIRPISNEHVGQWRGSPFAEEIIRWVENNPEIAEGLEEFGYEV